MTRQETLTGAPALIILSHLNQDLPGWVFWPQWLLGLGFVCVWFVWVWRDEG